MLRNTRTGFKPVLLHRAITKMPKRKQVKTKVKRVVKRKRNSYTVEQKTEVVTYAKERGNIRVAEHFNIDLSMVECWFKASLSWSDKTNGRKSALILNENFVFQSCIAELLNKENRCWPYYM